MWLTNAILLLATIIVVKVVAASDGAIGSQCLLLKDRYKSPTRHIYLLGRKRYASIQYGRHAPSRAKAALLLAGLRYKLGYMEITMELGTNSYCELEASMERFFDNHAVYDKLVVHTAAEWTGATENCSALEDITQSAVGLEPRIKMMVTGAAPLVQVHLHVHLMTGACNDKDCLSANSWDFYKNESALQRCGFFNDPIIGLSLQDSSFGKFNYSAKSTCVPVLLALEFGAKNTTFLRLLDYADHAKICMRPVLLQYDKELRRHLKTATTSFLFLDYELWDNETSKETRVRIVQPPPCYTKVYPCELDNTSAQFVGDVTPLAQAAPLLYEALVRLAPSPTDLRKVLEKSIDLEPEEAACAWALDNQAKFEKWFNTTEGKLRAVTLFCEESEPDYIKDNKFITSLINERVIETLELHFQNMPINCTDRNSINQWFNLENKGYTMTSLAGVIAMGEGASAAAGTFKDEETQIVFYDVPGDVKLNDAAWAVAGCALPLAYAIADFIAQQNWTRVVIISEDSSIADEITAALKENKVITFYKKKLEIATEEAAFSTLSNMKEFDLHTFFVNARASVAAMVLCAAARHGLTSDTKYAWIVREWRVPFVCIKNTTTDLVHNMRPFTVSYWWRGGNDSVPGLGGNKTIREAISSKLNGTTWPMMAAPQIDALLLLAHAVAANLRQYSQWRYDLHGAKASRMVSESYEQVTRTHPVAGVVQDLRQYDHSQHQPLVFVHAWSGNNSTLLQLMKVDDKGRISDKHILQQAYEGAVPYVGDIPCITIRSDLKEMKQKCHDVQVFSAVPFLVIMLLALWLALRACMRQLKDRKRRIQMRLLTRCERTASALSGHLVQQSALQIYEELGVGHFGRIRRGLLRLKQGRTGSTLVCVAVKALRADATAAQEAEFLREACALASLQHDHVVKLIGVCAFDGSPLLLMEHVFYGDLLRYLRERRYLALINLENSNVSESEKGFTDLEAAHVSPTQLTRLAREAADALHYLSQQRYVHRDVRAANCLLDQHRSLKLADFGMARKTSHTETNNSSLNAPLEDYSYICCRRGVFPVPWMAPESVNHGVFSSMSDVWSLGIMILEICSLGARPFGTWEPQRVLDHVRSGVYPPLPSDLAYDTREVLDMCWRLLPESRYTAAKIMSHLTESPTAVRPALHPAWSEEEPDESQAPDIGFGEQDGDNWPRDQPQSTATRV